MKPNPMMQVRPLPKNPIPALHQHLVEWPRFWDLPNPETIKPYRVYSVQAVAQCPKIVIPRPIIPKVVSSGIARALSLKPVAPIKSSKAERELWELGNKDDQYFRSSVFRALPNNIAEPVKAKYEKRFKKSRKKANEQLLKIRQRSEKILAPLASGDPFIHRAEKLFVSDELNSKTDSHYFGAWVNDKFYQPSQDAQGDLFSFKNEAEFLGDRRVADNDHFNTPVRADEIAHYFTRNDNQLKDYAKHMVKTVTALIQRLFDKGKELKKTEAETVIRTYWVVDDLLSQFRIKTPYKQECIWKGQEVDNFAQISREECECALTRVMDEKWWLRNLRRNHRQDYENLARACGNVWYKGECYVSDATFEYYRQRTAANKSALENMIAVNDTTGDEMQLSDVVEKSVSNPELRRHELMVRTRGTQEYAIEQGHGGIFATITCPSKFHATTMRGVLNPKFSGATPKQANDYLINLFAKIRAAFQKLELSPYGIRVVEPNHDGTPHHHYLLFAPEDQLEKIIEVMRHYAMLMDGREAGAKKYRFDAKTLDLTRTDKDGRVLGAVGYIAKYISKNIDGYQTDGGTFDDKYKTNSAIAAARITAWRKCYRLKAFSFFKSPSVQVYRQLRKFGEGQECEIPEIEPFRKACDESNWKDFFSAMGGPETPRQERPLQLLKKSEFNKTSYGELAAHRVTGVYFQDVLKNPVNKDIFFRNFKELVTSGDSWTLCRKGESPKTSPQDAVEAAEIVVSTGYQNVGISGGGPAPRPWCTVSNCILGATDHPLIHQIDQFLGRYARGVPENVYQILLERFLQGEKVTVFGQTPIQLRQDHNGSWEIVEVAEKKQALSQSDLATDWYLDLFLDEEAEKHVPARDYFGLQEVAQ